MLKQQKNASGQNINGATATNSTVEITIKENPFKMYAMLLISFSEIKSTSAWLSIYRFDGALVRRIKLASGQERLTISGKFLPPGCYIFRIQDGNALGSKRTMWSGR
jgi:hypothetical protein